MDRLRNQRVSVKKEATVKTEPNIKVEQISHADDSISARSDLSLSEEEGLISNLYNAIKSHKVGLGIRPFLRLPSKRMYPDYFVEIEKPISMLEIKRKIKNAQYSHVSDIVQDLSLMFANAMRYNQEYSEIWMTARDMMQYVLEKSRELFEEDNKIECLKIPSAAKRPKLSKRRSENSRKMSVVVNEHNKMSQSNILKLFAAIKESSVNGRHPVHTFIRTKDSSVLGLDELDISEIEKNVESQQYKSEQELVAALSKMFNNVKSQNGADSQPARDAITLRRVLDRRLRQLWASLPHANAVLVGDPTPIDIQTGSFSSCATLDAVAAVAAATQASDIDCDGNVQFSIGEDITTHENSHIPAFECSHNSSKMMYSVQSFSSPLCSQQNQDENRTLLESQLQALYSAVRSYKAHNGSQLMCTDFINLPPKAGYPDYYEIIKKPIDMTKIQLKITSGSYNSLDALIADFAHLFHNACIYNEPTSKIYSNALTLHRIMMSAAANIIKPFLDPMVQNEVQQILQCLLQAVLLVEDEDGRRYSDTFHENISSIIGYDGEYIYPLKYIEINLNKARYRRLDVFQDHFFQLCDYARNVVTTDMQIFEDSILLQTHFFKVRDDLCENGDRLASSAKSQTLRQFLIDVDTVQAHKSLIMTDQPLSCSFKLPPIATIEDDFHILEAQTTPLGILRIGYFVKLKESTNAFSQIVCIGGFRQNDNSELEIFPALHFLYPHQTEYSPARRFLNKEIFLCEVESAIPVNCVECICHVAYIKDFKSNLYKGISEENIFVCESFYHSLKKQFRKLKVWQSSTYYDELLCTPVHPPARLERHHLAIDPNLLDDQNWPTSILHKSPDEIPCDNEGSDGNRNFEQVFINQQYYKLGDFVLFRHSECKEPFILEITSIWRDTSGNTHAKGPYYVPTVYVPHEPTRLFYRNEILRYDTETIAVNFVDVIDRCSVLDLKKYCRSRPTEIKESNVFICDFKYFPEDKTIRRLRRTIKRPRAGLKITEDEIYFLKTELVPPKVASPHLLRAEADPSLDIGYNNQNVKDNNNVTAVSLDVSSNDSKLQSSQINLVMQNVQSLPKTSENTLLISTDVDINSLNSAWLSRQQGQKSRQKSKKANRSPCGYLLYADEIRKQLSAEYPAANYSVLSRKIGEQWRNLTEEERSVFEEKAKLQSKSFTFEAAMLMDDCEVTNNPFVSQRVSKMFNKILDMSNGHGYIPISNYSATMPAARKSSHSQLLQRLQSNSTDQINFSPKVKLPFQNPYSNPTLNRFAHSTGHPREIQSSSYESYNSPSPGLNCGTMSNRSSTINRFPKYNSAPMITQNTLPGNYNAMLIQRPISQAQQHMFIACPQSLFNSVNNQQIQNVYSTNRFENSPTCIASANRDVPPNLLVNLLSNNQSNNMPEQQENQKQITPPNVYGRFTQSKYADGPLIEIQSPGLRPPRPSIFQPQFTPSYNTSYNINNIERKRNHLDVYNGYLRRLTRPARLSKCDSGWQQKLELIEAAKADVAKELSANKDCVSSIEDIQDLYADKFKTLLKNNTEKRTSLYKWFSYIKSNKVDELANALSKLSKRLMLQSVQISNAINPVNINDEIDSAVEKDKDSVNNDIEATIETNEIVDDKYLQKNQQNPLVETVGDQLVSSTCLQQTEANDNLQIGIDVSLELNKIICQIEKSTVLS